MTTNRLVLLLLIPILQMRLTAGKGVIDIHFLSYSDDCDEAAGLGTCDPMFTFCVTRPDYPTSIHRSECYYKPTSQSGHYHDTNYINLAPITNIKGLANPWVFEADLKESSVKLVWRVQDSDLIGSDHMVTASIVLTEPVWPNVGVAKYQGRKSQKSDHVLRFEIRVYCTSNTYGSLCDVYCPPPSVTDRYYCDPDTGDRKCLEGWEGEDCDVNVDECSQGRCVHGECTDNVGSYTCENCDQGYSGQDCSIPDDPCQIKPCQNRGTCLPSPNTTTQYKCECDYPYTGPLCDDVITTTTTTEPTANTASTTTPVLSPSGPSSSSPTSTVTNRTNTGRSTKGPVAEASKAESAGFNTWIILVIALCLVFAIGSVIICFVCRRKKIIQRRKESRVPLSNVTYDGDTMAFDNNAYNHLQNGNVAGQGSIRESLPPPPVAPPITTQLAPPPSFHPDKGAWSGREEMDDDGYLKANDVPAFLRDVTDGLTASGRRAQSNLYSNFQGLGQKEPTSPPNPDYADEEHYHDLDETVMTLRNNNVSNGGDLRPLSAEEEEEGAYSDVPRNTPSYKTKVPQRNNYDLVRVRPDSRGLPKLPTAPADTQPETPRSEPQSSKATTRNTHYPPLANDPLRRTDPFASHVADNDYQTWDVDLPTRDFGAEYETPRNSQKGGRFAGEGEGGYELANSGGFHGENSNPPGGYEVPDISPYVTPSTGSDKALTPVSKAYDHLKPSIFHRSAAAPPPTYNNLGSVTAQAGETGNGKEEKEEADVDGDYLLSFPPPPPPIDPDDLETLDDDLDSVHVTGPRPLSFHTGQTEKETEEEEGSDEKTAKKKKNYLANGVFLNPLFGGVGPSDPTHSTTTDEAGGEEVVERSRPSRSGSSTLGIGSRPLSFHHGQTEIERGDEEDDNDDDGGADKDDDGGDENGDVKRLKKGLVNTGFVNQTFESDGPRDVTESGDSNKSRDDADVSGDVIIKNDDEASSQVNKPPSPPPPTAPKPGKAPPLYMENFGFDEMDL